MTKDQILAKIAANKRRITRLEGRNEALSRELVAKHSIGWIVVIDPSRSNAAPPKTYPIGPLDPIEFGSIRIIPSEDGGVPTVRAEVIFDSDQEGEPHYKINEWPISFGEERVVWSVRHEGRPEYSIQFFANETGALAAKNRPAPVTVPRAWAVITCPTSNGCRSLSMMRPVTCGTDHFGFGQQSNLELKLHATVVGDAVEVHVRVQHIDWEAPGKNHGRWSYGWSNEPRTVMLGTSTTIEARFLDEDKTRQVRVCCYATEAEARAAMPPPEADAPSASPIAAWT